VNDLTYYQALAIRLAVSAGVTLNFDEDGNHHEHETPVRSHRVGPPFCCSEADARWSMAPNGDTQR
jgi:hypothetical protein